MMPPAIEVRNLKFRYDDGTQALRGIDFRLERGESVALLGANGSGKSTFVLHLNGLLTGEGEIRICGLAMEKSNLAEIRRKVGMIFQDSESQLFMPTVLEDVAFGLLNEGIDPNEAEARAHAALSEVGMDGVASRAPYHLSAGEKKRVAIAGILAMQPEILVLDEPTTFLDPPGQRALAGLLADLRQAKIIVTHDIPFALATCQSAVFFQDGAIAATGGIEEIASRFNWRFSAEPAEARGLQQGD